LRSSAWVHQPLTIDKALEFYANCLMKLAGEACIEIDYSSVNIGIIDLRGFRG
jgi:hypothetical protein